MPLHPNVRRCTHIQITGHRCGSPALKQEYFCYFHTRMIKGVQTRVDSQIHPVALIESAEAIQAAIMHTIDAVLKGTLDNKRANIVLKALYIAVRNSRNVYFHLHQDDMIREVPNYAAQYLSEHPDQAQASTERSPAQSNQQPCHPEEAQAYAKRRPANEGPLYSNAQPNKKPSHAEEAPERSPAKEEPLHSNAQSNQKPCHPEEAQASAKRRPANEGPLHSNTQPNKKPSNPEEARTENREDIPLTTHQSQQWQEIKKLEACIEGARRGNWRDLRTVFNAVGLTRESKLNCHSERSEKSALSREPRKRNSQ
jgi:hypothetical protein